MDFWDLTKLLIRRWYIGLPMLLLSAMLTVLTFGQVRPDYVATANVQLVAPVQAATKPGETTPEQRNPWLGQGLQTLGNAAIITVLDKAVVKELKARGLSDSYTVEMGGTTPMVTFEVVGNSEQQARDTAALLVGKFQESVVELQSYDRVTKVDAISTRRLDRGENVEESDSKVKRALVAVAGAGLLLTAAVTIGMDALLRRRGGRRPVASATPVSPATGHAPPPRPADSPPTDVAVQPQPNGAGSTERDAATRKISIGNNAPSGAEASSAASAKNGGLSTVYATRQPANLPTSAGAPETDRKVAPEPEPQPEAEPPAEATIVLPRSLPPTEYSTDRHETTKPILRLRRPPRPSPPS